MRRATPAHPLTEDDLRRTIDAMAAMNPSGRVYELEAAIRDVLWQEDQGDAPRLDRLRELMCWELDEIASARAVEILERRPESDWTKG